GIGHGFTCPTGNPGEQCISPGLTGQPTGNGGAFTEAELDNFNITPASGGAAAIASAGATSGVVAAPPPTTPSPLTAKTYTFTGQPATITVPATTYKPKALTCTVTVPATGAASTVCK